MTRPGRGSLEAAVGQNEFPRYPTRGAQPSGGDPLSSVAVQLVDASPTAANRDWFDDRPWGRANAGPSRVHGRMDDVRPDHGVTLAAEFVHDV